MNFSTDTNDRMFHHGLDSMGYIREAVRYRAHVNMEFRKLIKGACEQDPLLFLNLFGFTHDPRREYSERTFLLYPYQEKAARTILSAVGVHDLRINHSADMGVSWLNVGLALWMWLFCPGIPTMFVTRTERYLLPGETPGVFWRLMYMYDRLPSWMQLDVAFSGGPFRWEHPSGSIIQGVSEAGAEYLCRGDRLAAVFIEDAWSLQDLPAVLRCMRDTTMSRIVSGRGAGGSESSTDSWDALRLHWSDHPLKSSGLYQGETKELLCVIDPAGYPRDYEPILDGRLRSPWYDNECAACGDLVSIRTEIDIELG